MKPHRITRSIRWRLLAWLAVVLGGVLVSFGWTAHQLHRANQFRELDERLEARVAAISADVRGPLPGGPGMGGPPHGDRRRMEPGERPDMMPGRPPPPEGEPGPAGPMYGPPRDDEVMLSTATLSLLGESDDHGFYYVVWSVDGDELLGSGNRPDRVPFPARSAGDTRTHVRTRGDFREAFHFTERSHAILVGRSIADLNAAAQHTAVWLGLAGAAVLAIGLWGAWVAVGQALRPIRKIGDTANRISSGRLSERIDVDDTESELGQLAAVLNSTFSRLDAAFSEQRRFTADAAHELRTPLAVIISESQTALARPRGAEDYRETIEGCLETAQRMRRLTESLLQLARFDAGEESMERMPLDLAEAVRTCLELVGTIAQARGVKVEPALEPAPVVGDFDRISRVVVNLLDNAIRYSPREGVIEVATCCGHGRAQVIVKDRGLGISPESLPHVFKRFYRADKARTGGDGHSGLGLAICKSIVEAHGGTISVSSLPGGGATFTVDLPAAK